MRAALEGLPWVDKGKPIDASIKTQRVVFHVTDMKQYNHEQLAGALKDKGFDNVKKLAPSS